MVFGGCNVRWDFTGEVCSLRNVISDFHERLTISTVSLSGIAWCMLA